MNYPVPHFGADEDMISTKNHWTEAEGKLGKWTIPKPGAPIPMDYPVPHFGLDQGILDSLESLKTQEAEKGVWNIPMDSFVQTDAERDPLLSKQFTQPATHPMNYFVPHFGEDEEILASKNHMAAEEKVLKTTWNPKIDEDGDYVLPETPHDFKLTNRDDDYLHKIHGVQDYACPHHS